MGTAAKKNIDVSYHDPYIPEFNGNHSEKLYKTTLMNKDIIIIATPHKAINYQKLVSLKKPILDTRNVLKNYSFPHIYRI